jgi:uncharacterized phage-associated protein
MAKAIDVAEYILKKRGSMTAMKMQKLVYYSQAWSLVWDEKPLFQDRIQAWANGPVAPALYYHHRGRFDVSPGTIPGDSEALTAQERATVDGVLSYYGDMSAQALSDLTHSEQPWKAAREGLAPTERGEKEITTEAMAEYYGSL